MKLFFRKILFSSISFSGFSLSFIERSFRTGVRVGIVVGIDRAYDHVTTRIGRTILDSLMSSTTRNFC